MRILSGIVAIGTVAVLLFGCASLERYRFADENKHRIRSLAVLPLIVGDESGRIETIGGSEFEKFVDYFDSRFYADFEMTVEMPDSVELKLPGRDFEIVVHNGMDYAAVAGDLGVDAVLAINLFLYNEIKPGAKGAQIAAAVVTTVLLGGYVKENAVAGFDTHFAYLDIEQVDEHLTFEHFGEMLPTIEEQRAHFVDRLLGHLDLRFPLSTDYEPVYRD